MSTNVYDPEREAELKAEAEKYIPPGYDSDLYKIRHSAAHIMAQAVMERFPGARIAIGPPVKDGFYYDFELPRSPTEEDLAWIEQRMKEIIKGKHRFHVREVSVEEARELFKDQPYKLELIEGLARGQYDEYGNKLPEDQRPKITVYQHDTFVDLCRGPHVEHTGQIKANAVKVMRVAGAYWRGDEKNPMLTRIYGTAWRNRVELEQYLKRLEEAKKRDHRRLGKDLAIFAIEPQMVGPGLVLATQRRGDSRPVGTLLERRANPPRLPARLHTAHRQSGTVQDQRALPLLQRFHVPPHGGG